MSGTSERRPLPDPGACREFAEQMLSLALHAGADEADVLVRNGSELEVITRLGRPELVKEAGSRALGLRVIKGDRSAVTYTSDLSPRALARLALEAVELTALAQADAAACIPKPEEMARATPDLGLWDDDVAALEVEEAIAMASRGDRAAMAADPRIGSSQATFGRTLVAFGFATSAGFSGSYRATNVSFVVEPVCDDVDGKRRNGHHWTASRHLAAIENADTVGVEAARRTVAQLGARKVPTCEAPVIFSPHAARGVLAHLAAAVSGRALWRKGTYLAGREGKLVASPLVTVVDDPLIMAGQGSRPFDGEGLPTRVNVIVEDGVLRTFLCDGFAARKLGRASTASAGRGVGAGPHLTTSNFILSAGQTPAAELERVERALYVTDLMGFGFNAVTGDYSQGASGFWIEHGERAHAVSEVTVSGSFDDLWTRIDAVGDDLDTRSSTQTPSFRVSRMTIAGS